MRFPFDYSDLGGGLNVGAAPSAIDRNECQILSNWYPYASRLRRRGGVRRLSTTAAWDEQITALYPLKTADGTWVLLVGGQTKFGKLSGTSIIDLAVGGTVNPIASALTPWIFFQYQNHAYALRPNQGQLLRLTADTVLDAGIAAPTAACVIAAGGAGTLSAADYRYVYTYYNTETGMESNPSPVSNTLALGANLTIDATGITISTNPFVDARRVYRTIPDQVGEYFFVYQISDNTTTGYAGENVAVADLGRTVSFNNGLPPTGLDTACIWNERMFASDGTDLFFSELLMPEMFSDDVIPVAPDDGHVIRGLIGFGDRLIIGKTNKMYFLVGTDRSDFALSVLSDVHGCKSHYSLQTAEGLLFWFGTGKAVYRSDGTSVHDISTPKVATILEAIPDDLETQVIGAVYPKLNWYLLSIPQVAGGDNAKVLIYNYKYGTWAVFEHPSGVAPQFLGNFFDTNYGHVLYSTFYDGHLYHYNDETYGTDWGNAIAAEVKFKKDDFDAPGYRKFFQEIWLLAPDATGTLEIEVFRDDNPIAVVTRTASLFYPESAWKAYRVQSSRTPGSTLELSLLYTGADAIDIDAIHFEVGVLKRRPMRAK